MHTLTTFHLRCVVIDSLSGGFKLGLLKIMTFGHSNTIKDTQMNVMSSTIMLVRTLLREEHDVQLL